jgi:hypothetical protein
MLAPCVFYWPLGRGEHKYVIEVVMNVEVCREWCIRLIVIWRSGSKGAFGNNV